MNNITLHLLVRWLGFDQAGDTWQDAADIATSVPDIVEDYLRNNPDDDTNRFLTVSAKILLAEQHIGPAGPRRSHIHEHPVRV